MAFKLIQRNRVRNETRMYTQEMLKCISNFLKYEIYLTSIEVVHKGIKSTGGK